MLAKLQAVQRKCYKEGSTKSLEIHPRFFSDPDGLAIIAAAYNMEKKRKDGDDFYNFVTAYIYSFRNKDENEREFNYILEWLDL